ncbi:Rho termination factor N-terminal domain-containing protein [uncultured Kushneria sp.]|uniref:Rho termination factor N-terminal domain-containing protein n=1 Tax=uncultured Kushneria sp. TaxID=905033 RepID=UPI00260B42F5|nr:Rho termination factor N-terminal domain-containing protein [uncultured Kushneria sp.]
MDLTALKTFNGKEGLVRAGQRLKDVETDRAKDLIRLGLASQYEVKPVEPETKTGGSKAPTIDDLRSEAQALGIEDAPKMKKADLEKAIKAKQGEQAQRDEQLKLAESLEIENAAELEPEALAAAIEEKQKAGE